MAAIPNRLEVVRIGIRVRRTVCGAVERNAIKRRVRNILFSKEFILIPGIDLVVTLHPSQSSPKATKIRRELLVLCKKIRVIP